MILPPRRPTYTRLKKIAAAHKSVMRCLEDELISEIELTGRTLDVGGGIKAKYYGLLKLQGQIDTLNINMQHKPTILADANRPFPLRDASYDNVLSFNTFEHLYKAPDALKECLRVLKPGGRFYFSIPFMFPVHGSPMDFNRHTADYWEAKLHDLSARDVVIEPIVWSPWTTAHASLEQFRGFRRFRRLVLLAALLDLWRHPKSPRLEGPAAQTYSRFAMGYFVSGRI